MLLSAVSGVALLATKFGHPVAPHCCEGHGVSTSSPRRLVFFAWPTKQTLRSSPEVATFWRQVGKINLQAQEQEEERSLGAAALAHSLLLGEGCLQQDLLPPGW